MRHSTAVAILLLFALPTEAATFSYVCRVSDKAFSVKINDEKNTLMWRGKLYKIKIEESCAKFGWRAERNGETFNFCTATQGYADFRVDGMLIQCNQDR